MLRLSPPGYQKINQANYFDIHYGGGEANVSIGLAQLGLNSVFVSKIPNNEVGSSAIQFLNRYGVDTKHVVLGEGRLGIYFLEKGYSIRPSKILYDRKNSSFCTSKLDEYNLTEIFSDADWFHVSGITPALTPDIFDLTENFLKEAKKQGVTVSFDLNYRSCLWSFEEARAKISRLMNYVDICIGIEPLQLLDKDGTDIKDKIDKKLNSDYYKEIMPLICQKYKFKQIAMTFRKEQLVNHHKLKSVLYDNNKFFYSKEVSVDIVDRVGTGDAFSTGLIYGLVNNFSPQETIDFANAVFSLKHTIEGDANIFTYLEVNQYIKHSESFSIKR